MSAGPKKPNDREGHKPNEYGIAREPGTFRIERLDCLARLNASGLT